MLIGKQHGHIKESIQKRQAQGIELVMSFKYLGMTITNTGKMHKDV